MPDFDFVNYFRSFLDWMSKQNILNDFIRECAIVNRIFMANFLKAHRLLLSLSVKPVFNSLKN